jgi:hypothetical protein
VVLALVPALHFRLATPPMAVPAAVVCLLRLARLRAVLAVPLVSWLAAVRLLVAVPLSFLVVLAPLLVVVLSL